MKIDKNIVSLIIDIKEPSEPYLVDRYEAYKDITIPFHKLLDTVYEMGGKIYIPDTLKEVDGETVVNDFKPLCTTKYYKKIEADVDFENNILADVTRKN